MTVTKKKINFFMTMDDAVYQKIIRLAKKRGINGQEFIRAIIIPEWLEKQGKPKNT